MSFELRKADPLVVHYADLIVHIESLVLARVPRLPLLPSPKELTGVEVYEIATRLADGARLAAEGTR
jgi:hypothetical protein